MKFQEEEIERDNIDRWLLTYSDMITLLMVFFIVMYAISSINLQKFQSISMELNHIIGGGKKSVLIEGNGDKIDFLTDDKKAANSIKKSGGQPEAAFPTPMPNLSAKTEDAIAKAAQNKEELKKVEESIREYIKQEKLSGEVSVYTDERGTVISLKEALLFELGSADIQPKRMESLGKIASIVSKIDNQIRVEGSTDDLPIHTAKFDSNWELAAQRAINVGKALIGYGISPERISCLSYGEYRPIVPNDSYQNRSRNRRVDIILIHKTLDSTEP